MPQYVREYSNLGAIAVTRRLVGRCSSSMHMAADAGPAPLHGQVVAPQSQETDEIVRMSRAIHNTCQFKS
jgi:hypothetical protein